jgi:hypothetical protein
MTRVHVERRLLSATVLGGMAVFFMFVIGCASTKAVVESPVETVISPPAVDPVLSPPIGPPPGYVAPANYWVREKIILTSEPEPPGSAPKKSVVKKGKKSQKTGKTVS